MKLDNNVKTLKIGELLTNDKYFIPIYQRNYSWGDEEVSYLIQDLWNAYLNNENKNYYIGSLVVNKKENGDFEVIDGQQRLTTLTLIMHYFCMNNLYENDFTRNVHFEHRKDSDWALENLESDNIPNVFKNALKSIKKYWAADQKTVDQQKNLADFLLTKVEIIRTEVPEKTDLNHYFEIMNTRGEQLEKHEILKARLMKNLPAKSFEQSLFAKIWDACSDMTQYAVMGIEPELRKNIFGEDWTNIPKPFTEIVDNYKGEEKDTTTDVDSQKNGNSKIDKPSIISLIENYNVKFVQSIQNNKFTNGSFNSVIDFPNFLMHVLRIYLEKSSNDKKVRDISLDEKYLLSYFNEEWDKDDVIKFIDILLSCRYLFDKYVIKSSELDFEYEHWTLRKIIKDKSKSGYDYKNPFYEYDYMDKKEQIKSIIMLLSMFHVSNPSRIYKNWLYAVLRWLFKNKDNITPGNYIDFLEDLCDKFYFGNNCQGKDITEIILEKVEFELNSGDKKDWNDGVNVPNFVFNRLDYQLWTKYKKTYPQFRFTFRSSVEHHYPQHPSEEHGLERLEKETLDNFGNLYLLSQSKNSRLSNLTPEAKCTYYQDKNYDSLKQALMMEKTKELNNWKTEEILKHGEEMWALLNTPIPEISKS
ncbi:DUF262 domain-containing HNH endonuclease family protein [Haemophilus sputorum]|uniref:DUF262 domain-containing protein n=1 Tax=Haemophilus sputorum TaxID=1078480 RepID=UPI002104D93E|nr:DUF262 domain-containing protein [Haemophilus sputorum]MCQ1858216.1 DUF262 domain-containing HNH endonuclease family protein [Haemophilus sputorum]